MQLCDCVIAPTIVWLECNIRPDWTEVQASSPMLRALWQQFESLSLHEVVLYRSFNSDKTVIRHYQLILPTEMKVAFLELIHSDAAGHLKLAKCIPHVMRRAWWFNWKRDLKLYIKCCKKCESFHRGQLPQQTNLKHVKTLLDPRVSAGPLTLLDPFHHPTGTDTCSLPFVCSANLAFVFLFVIRKLLQSRR